MQESWRLLVAVALLTSLSSCSPAEPSVPLDGRGGGIIAFSRGNGNQEIYVMNADGSGQRRLTNHGSNDTSPCLSPDGSKIAFSSNRKRQL